LRAFISRQFGSTEDHHEVIMSAFFPAARRFAPFLTLALFCVPAPRRAMAAADIAFSPEVVQQLEQRASEAKPREQCFLYAELVQVMTQKAGKEISDGDTEQATSTLKQIDKYAHMIHLNLARDTKRLKNAEILMHNTTYRLGQYLHLVSGDDQAVVKDTLKQLNQVNDELLAQVFNH
jgi:hypothetical protein